MTGELSLVLEARGEKRVSFFSLMLSFVFGSRRTLDHALGRCDVLWWWPPSPPHLPPSCPSTPTLRMRQASDAKLRAVCRMASRTASKYDAIPQEAMMLFLFSFPIGLTPLPRNYLHPGDDAIDSVVACAVRRIGNSSSNSA